VAVIVGLARGLPELLALVDVVPIDARVLVKHDRVWYTKRMNPMDIFVYSRPAVERISPHEVPHIFISITTPNDPEGLAKLPEVENTLGVLRLSFYDLDMPKGDATEADVFNAEHGDQVVNFVDLHRSKAERIIVHCDAGHSRSPAVAAAVAKMFYGQDDTPYFKRYRPNMRVFRGVLEAYVRKFSDESD